MLRSILLSRIGLASKITECFCWLNPWIITLHDDADLWKKAINTCLIEHIYILGLKKTKPCGRTWAPDAAALRVPGGAGALVAVASVALALSAGLLVDVEGARTLLPVARLRYVALWRCLATRCTLWSQLREGINVLIMWTFHHQRHKRNYVLTKWLTNARHMINVIPKF